MTRAENAARLLEAAAGHIERGWTTGANARDGRGHPVSSEKPEAVCWCAQGAMTKVAWELNLYAQARTVALDAARIALRRAITEHLPRRDLLAVSITLTITNWNDDEAQDGAQVARAMRRGAAILREAA